MCDYSLQAFKSRPAKIEDKLVVHNFGAGTAGLADANDPAREHAVCILPGTELALDPALVLSGDGIIRRTLEMMKIAEPAKPGENVATFIQINKGMERMHHDALRFSNGAERLLTSLPVGTEVTVLQLPAEPKNEAEREEQKREAFV
jgi:hypothetical protein